MVCRREEITRLKEIGGKRSVTLLMEDSPTDEAKRLPNSVRFILGQIGFAFLCNAAVAGHSSYKLPPNMLH